MTTDADTKPDSEPPPPDHRHADVVPVVKMKVDNLCAWYDETPALSQIRLRIVERCVTSLIGPAGCGKTTLLRCANRTHELVHGARVQGRVLLDGVDIYDARSDPTVVRRRIGMVFPRPNPFPNMTVRGNVLAGLHLNGLHAERPDELVETTLRHVGLWDEVKDDLHRKTTRLSLGQQQRLCIARALALEPEVLLLDEPTSLLDHITTRHIEELVHMLSDQITVIIATQNMRQAARMSDYTAFMYMGELVEFDRTDRILTNPRERRTEDYVTGKFG